MNENTFRPFTAKTYARKERTHPFCPLKVWKERWVFLFPNGFGASVIRGTTTFGGPEGFFELAVLKGKTPADAELCYETEVTPEVMGWLTTKMVVETLFQIQALPWEVNRMSDKDGAHMLSELQEARAEVDRLREAIRKHREAMAEYKGAFYDEELWKNIGPLPGEGGE